MSQPIFRARSPIQSTIFSGLLGIPQFLVNNFLVDESSNFPYSHPFPICLLLSSLYGPFAAPVVASTPETSRCHRLGRICQAHSNVNRARKKAVSHHPIPSSEGCCTSMIMSTLHEREREREDNRILDVLNVEFLVGGLLSLSNETSRTGFLATKLQATSPASLERKTPHVD